MLIAVGLHLRRDASLPLARIYLRDNIIGNDGFAGGGTSRSLLVEILGRGRGLGLDWVGNLSLRL